MPIKEQVKDLWKLCFDDSPEYVDMYFRLRYKNEENVALQSGDEVISALQMLPYPMTFCGATAQTAYISGACTHPEFRSRGVMRQLLSQAFTRMSWEGIHFSTLIPAEPWLFDYYRHMGYAPVFQHSVKEINLPEFIPSKGITVAVETQYRDHVYTYLNEKLAQRPCCVQHTADDFLVIMADLAISDGNLYVARRANTIVGLAITYNGESHITIAELLAEDKDVEYSLLHAIKQHTACCHLTQLLPLDEELPSHALGMARIISTKEVLQMYAAAFAEESAQLEVSDNQLSVNNGYYYLSGGRCRYSTDRLPGAHTQMNASQLTEWVFAKLHPYMSLMLD